ncbi:aspartyl/asparaginyl beta-hydroxylase domain-containing protein [Sphingomonas arenae]|uniref:aspartyl/asparaginyl beta-hydroxylase domain-containing protein n=1 Tax=Sphingomonas arenae TaxID=2812555 RepID=UPI00196847A8
MPLPRAVHPWCWPSAALRLHLVERLDVSFDLAALRRELGEVERQHGATIQTGPHHNGKWSRIGLVGPGGDPERSYAASGEEPRETPVLALMPTLRRWISNMDGQVHRAIISRMEPGAYVRWHRDPGESADRSVMRLHLPVLTSADCIMELAHHRVQLRPGILWYSDFTFPHRVFNSSNAPRVHIMIDLAATDRTRAVLPSRYWQERGRRRIARRLATAMFDASERLHEEGRYAADFRRKRQQSLARGEAFVPEQVGMKSAGHRTG